MVVLALAADKICESFTRTSNKMGCSQAYLLKPTHRDIAVTDRQYQDNAYYYHRKYRQSINSTNDLFA